MSVARPVIAKIKGTKDASEVIQAVGEVKGVGIKINKDPEVFMETPTKEDNRSPERRLKRKLDIDGLPFNRNEVIHDAYYTSIYSIEITNHQDQTNEVRYVPENKFKEVLEVEIERMLNRKFNLVKSESSFNRDKSTAYYAFGVYRDEENILGEIKVNSIEVLKEDIGNIANNVIYQFDITVPGFVYQHKFNRHDIEGFLKALSMFVISGERVPTFEELLTGQIIAVRSIGFPFIELQIKGEI